jgi:putative polyketide hydroxylase
MSRKIEVPVLVVGAGPAGLTAAIALARHGIDVLVVERRAELSSLPRATAVSLRSMELLRSWGLEEHIREREVEVEWTGMVAQTLAGSADGIAVPLGFPTREQSSLLSPTAPACVPQDHLEPVLLEHLQSLGGRALLGAEVAALDHGEAVLRDGRRIRARYVVAADGSRSAVRASRGIAMRGPEGLAHVVTALFRAPLWDIAGAHRHGIYMLGDNLLVPAGRGDRWLFGAYYDPEREHASDYTPERLADMIRAAAGVATVAPRIERIGSFAFAAQLADRYRDGDVFLAGDAAHRVTPRGGTGMNMAIHDGYDLGWKLAWVLRGWAADELLDTYEAERRPVAEHNVARSADPAGGRRGAEQELHADLGGRLAHVWVEPGVSTLDLLGDGLTLLVGDDAPAPHVAGGAPVTIRRVAPISLRGLGVPPGGSLLVRPDGVPWAAALSERLVA